MAWGDILNGFGGQQGLLMAGANLLSSQRGQEGAALSQGIMAGQQMQQQRARQAYLDKRQQAEDTKLQMQQAEMQRAAQERAKLGAFFQGGDSMAASSVAGVGASPEQSQFDPSALNAAQVLGGGQVQGSGLQGLDPGTARYLSALPPDQAREVYNKLLEDQRDAEKSFGLAQFNQGAQDRRLQYSESAQDRRQRAGFGNARALAEYQVRNRAPSAFEQKVQALMGGGVDQATAAKIAGGALTTSRDPMTGESTVVDYSDPSTWRNLQQQDTPTIDINQSAAPDDYSAGDISGAFGTSGAFENVVNRGAEFLGARQPFKSNAEASRTVSALQRDFQVDMASEIGGRPSNYSQQALEPIMTNPNKLFEGAESSYSAIQQQREMYAERLREAQAVANGRYPVKDRADAQRLVNRFENRINRYDSVLEQWGSGSRPSYASGASGRDQGDMPMPSQENNVPPPPEGVDPELWQYMSPEDRSLFQ